jgi:hypothetical protein
MKMRVESSYRMDVAQGEVTAFRYSLQLIVRKISEFRLDRPQFVIYAESASRVIRGKHFDGTGRAHDVALWRCEEIPKGCGELYQSGTEQSTAHCVI